MPGFLDALKEHGVTALVDVRSVPRSGYFTNYNKENLSDTLKHSHIIYRSYAREFGARQEDTRFYTNGHLDFGKFAVSPQFKEGMEKIFAGMDMGYVFAFMCAEKDPMTCHRAILVTHEFAKQGVRVIHILPNGKTETQEELDERLLDKYFPDRGQNSIFEEENDESALLAEAYRQQNAVIGYRIGEENE